MSEQSLNTPTATATQPPQSHAPTFRLPSPEVALPLIAILGYSAFLISGFGKDLGPSVQPLPIYAFLGLLLLALQAVISTKASVAGIIYTFVTSSLALIYAAFVYFDKADNFARHAAFYFVVNTMLVVVFIYDAIARRVRTGALDGSAQAMPAQMKPFSFGSFAVDFAGLAILLYIAYGLLNFIVSVPIGATQQTINLNLDQIGLNIPNIPTLQQLDLVIAVGATAVALLLTGIVGVVAVAGQGTGAGSGGAAVGTFGGALGRIANTAANQVLLSLRLVLSPLVWLIPSFSIAVFSNNFTNYLNLAAATRNAPWDLINPFSAKAAANYGNAFAQLGLGVLSVAAVILAVAVVEHDGEIIQRTLQVLGVAGRTVALTLAFFTFSLAFLNMVLVLVRPQTSEPFQVGGSTLIALVAGGIFAGYVALRERARKPA